MPVLIILFAMNIIKRIYSWLFSVHESPPSWWRVILWWEIRRIPYNLIIAVYGFVSLLIFFWAILTSGQLQPGEDAVEPIGLILAPFAVNFCYTFGWLAELSVRLVYPSLSVRFSPILLKIGIFFSLFMISLPSGFWLTYRLLQIFGFINYKS